MKISHLKGFSIVSAIVIIFIFGFFATKKYLSNKYNTNLEIGSIIDSLNGVYVYYNGDVNNISIRNLSKDKLKYNYGLKYQCVEFTKRYYYDYLKHQMPDTYGHARDFFIRNLKDGEINTQRDLMQYSNPSKSRPEINDLVIFSETIFNSFGHVAIISEIYENEIEIIQQNAGKTEKSRITYNLKIINGKWKIDNDRIIGWLRLK